jgi:PAS domain S-box-containing protein
MTDETGRITTWNAAAQRMFGFTAERALGRGIHLLDSDDRETRFSALVNQVLQIGEPIEAQVVCADAEGKHVQVGVSLAPIRDTHGAVLGTSIVMRDDAEYNRVQEALREANRQKDEFLAIMSHELRTPLTSILGYTDMLMRGLSGPLAPMTNKYVGNVRAAGDRLLELVNGLLDYTRLEAGVERLDVKPVDLVKLADQVVQNCQSMARSKGVELRMATSSGIQARVDVDEQRVVHVLRSLVNNAVKFTPTGGSVNVVVDIDEERANAVRVSVHDSGIGLREDQIGRVWDRFYQGDLSLTRPYGGMGLGLSIARHLVTLHGGTVGAESRGPGRGSTFWFSLPLAS